MQDDLKAQLANTLASANTEAAESELSEEVNRLQSMLSASEVD